MENKKHLINQQLDALLTGETNLTANLANASALLNSFLPNINWVGFYLYDNANDELVLGPFQGQVACMHIQNGHGVCGTAFKNHEVTIVKDVNKFPGHIACDANSQSEIVIPLFKDNYPIGVLDIDAPVTNRFSEEDAEVLSEFAEVLIKHIDL